jgi:hypothetical protein
MHKIPWFRENPWYNNNSKCTPSKFIQHLAFALLCTCSQLHLQHIAYTYTADTYYAYVNCSLKYTVSWGIILCSPVEVQDHFGGLCCLRLQGQRLNQERNLHRTGVTSQKIVLELWEPQIQNLALLILCKWYISGFSLFIIMWNAKIMCAVYHWKSCFMMKCSLAASTNYHHWWWWLLFELL